MKKVIYFLLIGFCAWLVVGNPLTTEYVSKLRYESIIVSNSQSTLYNEIVEKAAVYYRPAIDAKIDPVWKAIPGYNGVEVDVDASYKKMKSAGKFVEEKLVLTEIEPKIHLKDLPPTAIYKGNPEKKMVSFIINVAWGNEYLSDILKILKKYNVKASFFLEGRWVQKNPELARMIVEAGHEVGNHSYTHPDMRVISSSAIREEILKTNDVIEATTGKIPEWFTPPSGSYREDVVKIAAEEKLGTLMWSVDTIDWQKPTPQTLITRVITKIHNGAMVLMHPTDSTARSLEQLIIQLSAKGYEINTISNLMSENHIFTKTQ